MGKITNAKRKIFCDANTKKTRFSLVDGVDEGLRGIPVLGSRTPGGLEIYIGPSYEETALMLAEALIRTGDIEHALGYIDQVRSYQGAGVAAVKGTGLTPAGAMQ